MNDHEISPALKLIPLASVFFLVGCLSNPQRPEPPGHDGADNRQSPSATIIDTIGNLEAALPHAEDPKPATQSGALETLPAPRDLWERIRRGLALSQPDHPRIERELDWLRSHPTYLERVTRRARPYLHYIVEEVERRGLPLDLALLPVIESGFHPRARSHLRAAGLWQFMPATGEAFGLKNSWWYDGRYDVTASTRAAMDYLSSLAGQFDGDWQLALAAYNAGPGTVRAAIRKNRSKGLPADYWSLNLPRETRQYVPRLLAVAKAVRDPERHGLRLTPLPDRPHFAQVTLPRQIDLQKVTELAGVDEETLRLLNPGLRRWATDPEGPHRLLLPIDKAARFEQKLAGLAQENWVAYHRYRIRRGDTLGGIAYRYGVEVAELKRANGLRGSRIRAGKDLIIPVPGGERDVADRAVPDSVAGSLTTARAPAAGFTHTVQPGDTLWDIARAHEIGHRQLAAWNNLSVNDTLRPGQALRLRPVESEDSRFYYRVQEGDSLYRIAQRFNVTIDNLRRWNGLSGGYLKPGQQLTLRLQQPTSAAAL